MRCLAFALLLSCAAAAVAAPVALNDDELAGVNGRDGVSIAVHLELHTTALAGFRVGGTTTYAVLQDLGGALDLFTLTLDVKRRADGADYIAIGLPGHIGAKQFGFRALAAQTDPLAPIAPAGSYGQLLLHGNGAMTGQLLIWGAP